MPKSAPSAVAISADGAMDAVNGADEPWWKRELRKRRGRIKSMRSQIAHLQSVLMRNNVPEGDWRFDNSSDEEFDKGFYSSKAFQTATQNCDGSKPKEVDQISVSGNVSGPPARSTATGGPDHKGAGGAPDGSPAYIVPRSQSQRA